MCNYLCVSVLELLCLDLLGENRFENQLSDRVLESLSCPPTAAAVEDEKEDEDSNPIPRPEKPKVRGPPALRPPPPPPAAPAPPFVAAATPHSTSAGAEDGARSKRPSPFVAAGPRPSGVECGARMPRVRMILNTCEDERDTY